MKTGLIVTAALTFALSGCADYGENTDDGGTRQDGDAQPADPGPADPGPADPGPADTGPFDAGPFDAGPSDAGPSDAGPADSGPLDCGTWIAAVADCPFQWTTELAPGSCPQPVCLDAPCRTDADCPISAAARLGDACVTGNCVYCWQDTHCPQGQLCRAGRCLAPDPEACLPAPACTEDRCRLTVTSEGNCPVCVCDSIFTNSCSTDEECLIWSHHPYRRCVNGRCADCRNDDDCAWGACLPPGLCFGMEPHPEALYGTWLLGWAGGLDHFSYFRFEPDGTFRRGVYQPEVAWSDDIPGLPCWPDPWPAPAMGTWEPHETASGFLVVAASLNLSCDGGDGWWARYVVNLEAGSPWAVFDDIDSDADYQGIRMAPEACTPDFTRCESPSYP